MEHFAQIIEHLQENSKEDQPTDQPTDQSTDQSTPARAAKCQPALSEAEPARPNAPQSAIAPERRAPQSAVMCHQAPPGAAFAKTIEFEKTNPPSASSSAYVELTMTQRAAARLLVAGARTTQIAEELHLNRHTIPRWKRVPAFAAELCRLQSLADRALALKVMNHAPPGAAPKSVSRPPVRTPSVNQSPAKETFAQATIRLGQEGVFPFNDLAEFRRRMREAGFDL